MQSIDVVIPVLDDADALRSLLASIRGAALPGNCALAIIVVDGGSSDNSVAVAESANAIVIKRDGGRGPQLALGCRAGAGEWLLMLHADSYLQPDAFAALRERLTEKAECDWGILGHDYESGGLPARWALISNRLRFHLLGIAFGDQGIFVRRSVLEDVGGIPELPLMEDVELSLRLRGRRRTSLGRYLIASARRFETGGWRYWFTALRLTSCWLFARARGAAPLPLAQRMRDDYYRK